MTKKLKQEQIDTFSLKVLFTKHSEARNTLKRKGSLFSFWKTTKKVEKRAEAKQAMCVYQELHLVNDSYDHLSHSS